MWIPAREAPRLTRHVPGAAHFRHTARLHAAVGPEGDLRVEHGHDPLEVAVERGRAEGVVAALVLSIGTINLWNRLNAATRQVGGPYLEQYA